MINTYTIGGPALVGLANLMISSAQQPVNNGADTYMNIQSVIARLQGVGNSGVQFIMRDLRTGQNYIDSEYYTHVRGHYDHFRHYIATLEMPANTDGIDAVQLVISEYDGIMNPEIAANMAFIWLLRSYGYYLNLQFVELQGTDNYNVSRAICFWDSNYIDAGIVRLIRTWFDTRNMICDSQTY